VQKTIHSQAHNALVEALVAARKQAGLTQEALAMELDRPQSFVAKYERSERRLDLIELLRIARVLNVDAHAILDVLIAIEN